MNEQQQLTELEELASGLSVRVCYEPMAGLVQGVGGLCRVRGEYRVIIDRRLKSAVAVSGFQRLVAPELKGVHDTPADGLVVFDDQNALLCHALISNSPG